MRGLPAPPVGAHARADTAAAGSVRGRVQAQRQRRVLASRLHTITAPSAATASVGGSATPLGAQVSDVQAWPRGETSKCVCGKSLSRMCLTRLTRPCLQLPQSQLLCGPIQAHRAVRGRRQQRALLGRREGKVPRSRRERRHDLPLRCALRPQLHAVVCARGEQGTKEGTRPSHLAQLCWMRLHEPQTRALTRVARSGRTCQEAEQRHAPCSPRE